MKILFAATPAAGHINPILTLVHMVRSRGDEAVVTTATSLKSAVEKSGARFLALARGADLDLTRAEDVFPELRTVPPGPELIRYILERVLIDTMPAQCETLRAAIAEEQPDVVVTDGAFMGRAALFLDPRRPSVPLVSCGFSILSLDRPDGAPYGLGLPPARDEADRVRYAAISAEFDAKVTDPVRAYADGKLANLDLPPLPCSVLASFNLLADAYLHPTVPAFEYDYGPLPDRVRFVGPLPPPPSRKDPPPAWWGDLDAGKPVVLVTQGTVTNADFGELVEPTLQALAARDDLLVVVTTGGRPVESLRGPVSANTRLAEFVDYGALLPKVSALVTNGGYGTVQLALRAGVPIVAAGRTEEKADIGARVAWSGVGIEIPKQRPSAGEVREAVGKVLSDPSYRARAQAIAADMAAIDTRAEILGVLDGLVEQSRQPAGDGARRRSSRSTV